MCSAPVTLKATLLSVANAAIVCTHGIQDVGRRLRESASRAAVAASNVESTAGISGVDRIWRESEGHNTT